MNNGKIRSTSKFKKDMKTYKHDKTLENEIGIFLNIVMSGQPIPRKYDNHDAKGCYKGEYDCHIRPNVCLIWHKEGDKIVLSRIGSHNKIHLTETAGTSLKLHIKENYEDRKSI